MKRIGPRLVVIGMLALIGEFLIVFNTETVDWPSWLLPVAAVCIIVGLLLIAIKIVRDMRA